MTALVRAIPRWVKEAAFELGAMTAIERRDVVVLAVMEREGTRAVKKSFSAVEYASDPDGGWRQVLAAFKVAEA